MRTRNHGAQQLTLRVVDLNSRKRELLNDIEHRLVEGLQAGLQAIREAPPGGWRILQRTACAAAKAAGLPAEYARVVGYHAYSIFRRHAAPPAGLREIWVGARSYRIARSPRGRWIVRLSTLRARETIALPLHVPRSIEDVVRAIRAGSTRRDARLFRVEDGWYIVLPIKLPGRQ